ncbi:MAG: GtrA family protein [Saprospiraceae bacterium]
MEKTKTSTRPVSFLTSWVRAQGAAIAATTVDFLVTILFTELFGVYYVWSNATGAFCGAVISFLLCRHWAFKRSDKRWTWQALRYMLASGLSIYLNTLGVWLITEAYGMPYLWSKVIVASFIGLTVNFLTFRYFVFR